MFMSYNYAVAQQDNQWGVWGGAPSEAIGVWMQSPQLPETEDLGKNFQPPEARDDFCNFFIKITHFMHISAKIVTLKQ